MPIDPSIPLSVKPPNVDVLGGMHRAMQLRAVGQENQLRQLELESRTREAADDAASRTALQSGDPDQAVDTLMKTGHPNAALKLSTTLQNQRKQKWETQKLQLEVADKTNDSVLRILQGVKDEDTFQFAKKAIVGAIANDPPQAAAIAQHMGDHYDPAKMPSLINEHLKATDFIRQNHYATTERQKADELRFAEPEKKAQAVAAWTKIVASDLSNAKNQQEWDAAIKNNQDAPASVLAKFPTQWSADNAKKAASLGMTPAEQSTAANQGAHLVLSWADLNERKRHNKEIEEGVELSPEAIDKAADMFATTGAMPSFGFGNAGAKMRKQVYERAAQKYPDVVWASNSAQFKANQASLTQLQKQSDAVTAFSSTAHKNLDVFLQQAKKVVDSGSPLMNEPLRKLEDKVLGSEGMAAFKTARMTVVPEFAKILNNPTMAGQLSDSARHEIDELLPPDATLKQIYQASQVLLTDTENRKSSYGEQIAQIKGRMQSPTGATEPAKQPAAKEAPKEVAALLASKAAGKYKMSDGSWWEKTKDGTVQPTTPVEKK